ncbi:hypothetical protein EVAR_9516_1 [Eumeta japonica]|uniref:Uncharacterized protein n=1 Tax=Eumeta variegata TaxID=151549 RepID=A0A4C1U535_EUMVA|nr:hypothetical protein EVAR_9516_1 [Eumeta japonica]
MRCTPFAILPTHTRDKKTLRHLDLNANARLRGVTTRPERGDVPHGHFDGFIAAVAAAYVFVRFRSSSSRFARASYSRTISIHVKRTLGRATWQAEWGVLGFIFVTEFLDSVAALKARDKSYA